MDYQRVLARAGRLVWNLRVLWLFGFILALTTSSGVFWLWGANDQDARPGIAFKISDENTITILDEGMTIDFASPGGPQVFFWDGDGWLNIDQARELLLEFVPGEVWTILIFAAVELGLLLLIGILLRYTSEAAVIRSVQVNEQEPGNLSFRQSLRLGWSRAAWRFFGIDLLITVVAGLVLGLLFLLALSPLLLWSVGVDAARFVGTGLTVALLIAWGAVAALTAMGASMLRQVSWRVSSQEGCGILASIRRGVIVIRRNFQEVIATWLIWLGARILWFVLIIAVIVILAPLLLGSVVAGVLLGLVPALLTLGIAGMYVQGITPWVLAGLAALPVFVVVTLSPVIFVSGWARIFLSNLWTLAYHQLPAVVEVETVPENRTDAASMDMAPAS